MPGRTALLGPNQEAFARELAAKTGLDVDVVRAWEHAEQPADSPATGQLPYNDWLNIGWTSAGRTKITYDPGWFGGPKGGADLTAAWLKGQWGDQYGYPATPGVRGILRAAGQSPEAQIRAIQGSGWASSGYPQLAASYAAVHGSPLGTGPLSPSQPGQVPNYTQPSSPSKGSFWGSIWGGIEGAAGGVAHGAEWLAGGAEDVGEAAIGDTLGFLKAALWLVNPLTWLRAAETIFGVIFMLAGILVMVGADKALSSAPGPTGAAASLAAAE